jgi:indole-3-glycerol phosphate synthase
MILNTIAEHARYRVEAAKQFVPYELIKAQAEASTVTSPFAFEKALMKNDLAFICEVKKASPSKGIIAEYFPYVQIACQYEAAGASAISVLTEPKFFMGSSQYLTEIKSAVSIPVLRKDFTVDPYQIYKAKLIGADAVLLICSLLDTPTLKEYIKIADSLGMSCLVEAHDEKEVYNALSAGARIIGVNNRDLRTFEVDIANSIRLRELVPKEILFVSESGIKTPADIEPLRKNGTNAVLIGETLMTSSNIKQELDRLRG